MHLYVRAILIFFYVANSYKVAKRTAKSLSLLSRNEGYLRTTNLHNQFWAAIALKRSMLRVNAIMGITYNLAIVVGLNCHWGQNGIPGKRSKDGLISFCIIKEILEISLLTLLFMNVRPRNWPSFFMLDMTED